MLVQPIQPTTRNSKVYGEILARFLSANEEPLPTASLFAMAEKLDKITAIDQMIIAKAIDEITQKIYKDTILVLISVLEVFMINTSLFG